MQLPLVLGAPLNSSSSRDSQKRANITSRTRGKAPEKKRAIQIRSRHNIAYLLARAEGTGRAACDRRFGSNAEEQDFGKKSSSGEYVLRQTNLEDWQIFPKICTLPPLQACFQTTKTTWGCARTIPCVSSRLRDVGRFQIDWVLNCRTELQFKTHYVTIFSK